MPSENVVFKTNRCLTWRMLRCRSKKISLSDFAEPPATQKKGLEVFRSFFVRHMPGKI